MNLRARYYDPGTGRFMSRDTWGGNNNRSLSLNKWSYVEGNPISYIDPTGFYVWRWSTDPLYHQRIENEWISRSGLFVFDPNRQLEYTIPGIGIRPDMFNSLTGEVYEIEPLNPINNIYDGYVQVLGYIAALNDASIMGQLDGHYLGIPYNWNVRAFMEGGRSGWGWKYRKSPLPGNPFVDLVADYYSPGMIAYWFEINATLPVLLAALAANMEISPNMKNTFGPNLNPVPGYAYATFAEMNPELFKLEPSECATILAYGQVSNILRITQNPFEIGIPDLIIPIPGSKESVAISLSLMLGYILKFALAN